jgi:hypothetical protein
MPYKWTLTSGNLPPGLSLQTLNSGRSGFLVGKPTQIGTYNWRYTITDDQSPTPASTYADYAMTVSGSLVLTGYLVDDGGRLPPMTKNVSLDGSFSNRLLVTELGAHSSTFSVTVIGGTKPSWLTISVTPTVNQLAYTGKFCFASINFTGTPTEAIATQFTIRVTSSSGAFQDLPVSISVGSVTTTSPQVDTFYTLTADKTQISEGESVTFTLVTANYNDGDVIPWQIEPGTGFTTSDVVGGQFSGNFTLTTVVDRVPIFQSIGGILSEYLVGYQETKYQTASVTVTASADVSTEGIEYFRFKLPTIIQQAPPGSITYVDIGVKDTSQAVAVPTYSLTASPTSIQEGDVFSATLTTTNVPQGTKFAYRVTGITSTDLDGMPLTGYFTVGADGTSTITFSTLPNGYYDPKTAVIAISSLNLSARVAIADANPTYSLSASASAIAEGKSVSFNLRTTSVADGTTYNYSITGVSSADIDKPLTGTITVNNNSGGIVVTALNDLTTEGFETMTFSLPTLGLISQVVINDTSVTPAPINYYLTLTNSNGINMSSSSEITEGDLFFITVDASEAAIGSGVRYSISGLPQTMCSIPLTGTWTLYDRYLSFLNAEYVSAFYSTGVTTSKSGETNTQRVVTVTLTDLGISNSFKLNSPIVTNTPPPSPPSGNKTPYNPPPKPTTNPLTLFASTSLPNGTVNVYYDSSVYVSHTGGVAPLTWAVTSGSLPVGMSGITENETDEGSYFYLVGAPTTAGTSTFTITATDSVGVSNTFVGSITVAASQSGTGGVDPGSGGIVDNVTDPVDLWELYLGG